MRYAVFADIHSNLEAFEAVLRVCRKSRLDGYLFVGDIVGYGADAAAVLSLLRDLNFRGVGGNHDSAVCGVMETDAFNEAARESVVWTKKRIGEADKRFLLGLPLVVEKEDFCLVHGTLPFPEEFQYMIDSYQAAKTFLELKEKICFVGHLHVSGVFVEEEKRIFYSSPAQLRIKESERYIVNVGSVGQPRDQDPRACFCIYDTQKASIEFKRVAYDVATAQKKIMDAGLPRFLAERLAVGR